MAETDFPDGFQGAGPVYAAVPMGEPWLDLAIRGATTYVLQAPGTGPDLDPEAYAGFSAFLDRGRVEEIAEARGDAMFTRWEGLTRYYDMSPAAAAQMREADEDLISGLDSLPEAGS